MVVESCCCCGALSQIGIVLTAVGVCCVVAPIGKGVIGVTGAPIGKGAIGVTDESADAATVVAIFKNYFPVSNHKR